MPKYYYELAGAEQKDVFVQLVKENFSQKAADIRETIWDWGLTDNPASATLAGEVILLKKEQEVIGAAYMMPFQIKNGEVTEIGYWTCGISVKQKYRGRGTIIIRYVSPHDILYMGFPFDKILPIYFRRGAGVITKTEQCFCLINVGCWLARKHPKIRPISGILNSGWSVINKALIRNTPKGDFTVHRIEHFNEQFDEFWQRASSKYSTLVIRDSSYLNWRFFQCPLHRYDVLAIFKSDMLAGYVVYRIADINGQKTGIIVDLLVEYGDTHCFEHLLAYARDALKKQQVDIITMMKSIDTTWIESSLRRQGFRFKKPHLAMIAGSQHYKRIKAGFLNTKGWVTFSDSDNDLF